jgi:glycosyltransferase involved in cell wall biosynthesis
MEIIIKNGKDSSIFYNGVFYDTNKTIDMDISDALRLSRIVNVEYKDMEKYQYDPQTWKERKLNLVSDIDVTSGWGNASLNLIDSCKDVEFSAIGRSYDVHNPKVLAALKRPIVKNGVGIWHEQPKDTWKNSPFGKNIAIVPFETTRVPASWVPKINLFDALFVPCQQNVEMFQDSGVTIPIEVIHWGIDPKKFYPLERNNSVFTFGTMGALSKRKGTDLLVEAFQKAFPTEQDVKLICKSSFNGFLWAKRDKRIEVNLTPVEHKELLDTFFKRIDCFVFPTRGEGFGLPPLEAMATGVPAIVTNWSGPVDYMTEEVGWLLDYKMVPATEFTEGVYKEDCGDWAEPSLEDLIKKMRYAYEHKDEVKLKGRKSSDYVRENWTWDKRIGEFEEALNKHL